MRWRQVPRIVLRRLLVQDFRTLMDRVDQQQRSLEDTRSRIDVGLDLAREFQRAREADEYQRAFSDSRPTVSICVGTFNRSDLLVGRCLPSLLSQTYPHIEIIVIGDGCSDDTEERVKSLDDPRIIFENLFKQGPYPSDPRRRWQVAGTASVNRALELASGTFITHLDDDDEHAPERVERLLELAQAEHADLVWHPFHAQGRDGTWALNDAATFEHARVTTSSILYHSWFKRLPWDVEAHFYDEPGDWNRLRKIRWLGAHLVRHDQPLLRHYRERNQ